MVGDSPKMSTSVGRSLDTAVSYGWKSAYGFLVVTLVSYALGAMFFIEGGIYGPLSDAAALLVGLFMLPLVWVLHLLTHEHDWSRETMWLGVGSVALVSVGSLGLLIGDLLSLGAVGGGFLGLQFLGIVLEGVWLLAVGVLGLRTLAVPRSVSLAALAAGLGYAGGIVALSATYALSLSVGNPVFLLAAALAFGGIVAWSVLLGRELQSRDRQMRRTTGFGTGQSGL